MTLKQRIEGIAKLAKTADCHDEALHSMGVGFFDCWSKMHSNENIAEFGHLNKEINDFLIQFFILDKT